MTAMMDEIGATLSPPTPAWMALIENKDKVYAKFNKFMLPARWVTLGAVAGWSRMQPNWLPMQTIW